MMRTAFFAGIAVFCCALAATAHATEREASIDGGRAPLFGTVETGSTPVRGPAVLILAGSGPTDRDGNSRGAEPANELRQLADVLAAAGIVSLRTDKRGIGKSAAALTDEAGLTINTYVDDAVNWTKWLAKQPGVTCVVIAGHSEGALIAILAAQRTAVCGVISLEGPGRRLSDNLSKQLARVLPPDIAAKADKILSELAAGRRVADPDPSLAGQFRPSIQPYLISEFSLDPMLEVQKFKAPLLLTAGTRDAKVTLEDFRILAKARPDAAQIVVPDMIHPLKIVPAGSARPSGGLAGIPLAPPIAAGVVDFVRHLTP